ncbi:hypothetical protein [Burkholderia pseudomallei]|uniref:hypothetical protein n=1 Tax=Burkholderia pseudomallei TaxID=28450 RepID=UPI001377B200|nr:hypothetical protein [Burkholderia pseudomallei]
MLERRPFACPPIGDGDIRGAIAHRAACTVKRHAAQARGSLVIGGAQAHANDASIDWYIERSAMPPVRGIGADDARSRMRRSSRPHACGFATTLATPMRASGVGAGAHRTASANRVEM